MRSAAFCALSLLLTGSCLVTLAAEPEPDPGVIETLLGQTSWFQFVSSTPTGRPEPVVRVQNPNRDYLVVKVTFEAGEVGGKNRIRVRNGYDEAVMFKMDDGCRHLTDPKSETPDAAHLMIGVRPAGEFSWEAPVSVGKIVMCDFTLVRTVSKALQERLESLQLPAPPQ
jgi:hypothetical protein